MTADDATHSAYEYVKTTGYAHESLNFGHELYPAEADGTYVGYSPMLNKQPRAEHLGAVFFLSTDHRNRRCIVGLYAFPQIGHTERRAKHRMFKQYRDGNVRARVEDIFCFRTPIIIDERVIARRKLLPKGKSLSKQGFNYLTSENVISLLQLAVKANQHDQQLAALLDRFMVDDAQEPGDLGGLGDLTGSEAETLAGIEQLEARMKQLQPRVKQRVSSFIERGSIATAVKRHTGYKCLLCQAMGLNPVGFLKTNGIPYVEAHHVDPVSNLNAGALGLSNIITLCANHHRQMHYGDVRLVELTKTRFKFLVDGMTYSIRKIKV